MTRGVCGEDQLLAAVRSEVVEVSGGMNNTLRSGKASLMGDEFLVTRVATPEPMSMKVIG